MPRYNTNSEWYRALRPEELAEVEQIDREHAALSDRLRTIMARRDLLQKRGRERLRWLAGQTTAQKRQQSSCALDDRGV